MPLISKVGRLAPHKERLRILELFEQDQRAKSPELDHHGLMQTSDTQLQHSQLGRGQQLRLPAVLT